MHPNKPMLLKFWQSELSAKVFTEKQFIEEDNPFEIKKGSP